MYRATKSVLVNLVVSVPVFFLIPFLLYFFTVKHVEYSTPQCSDKLSSEPSKNWDDLSKLANNKIIQLKEYDNPINSFVEKNSYYGLKYDLYIKNELDTKLYNFVCGEKKYDFIRVPYDLFYPSSENSTTIKIPYGEEKRIHSDILNARQNIGLNNLWYDFASSSPAATAFTCGEFSGSAENRKRGCFVYKVKLNNFSKISLSIFWFLVWLGFLTFLRSWVVPFCRKGIKSFLKEE